MNTSNSHQDHTPEAPPFHGGDPQLRPTPTPSPPDPSQAVLFVLGLSKTYQNVEAVRDLSFCVAPGEVLGMVGPNGAGKTTTMRSIAGIIPPSTGQIAVQGHNVAHNPIAAKQRLAYVPDDPRLFDALTVWEHLEFFARAYRVDSFEDRAEQLLDRFELTDRRDTPAQELSRGMRQKTAICCACIHDPALLMLDEPMAGLDPRGIRTMKQTLLDRAAAGAAVIVSSHLLNLIEDMCSHLLVLHRGQRMFFGSVNEARAMITRADGDRQASLEDVFFQITEGDRPTPSAE